MTSLAATIAVEPPTLPAVCTRIIGLPAAPSASARYSSGMTTPSNMSGALPITTASMSPQSRPASSSASCAASRTSPAIETSWRAETCRVWPTPMTAVRSAPMASCPSRTHTRFCCRHGPCAAWATPRPARPSMIRLATSPMRTRPAAIIGFDVSAPPDGFTSTSSAMPSASRRISSSWLNWAWISATSIAPSVAPAFSRGQGRRRRRRQVPQPEVLRVDPVLDAPDPCRPLAVLPGDVVGRDHDGRGAVGDRRDVASPAAGGASPAGRAGRRRSRPRRSTACGLRCALRRLRAATSARSRSVRPDAVRYASACSAAMSTMDGHSGRHRVRVGLQRPDLVQVTERRLAEAVDDRAVDVAGLDRHPGFVQRPGRVHLDVALLDRRPRAHPVETHHERERSAGEVVAGPRDREVDVASLHAGALDRLAHHRD